MRRDDLKFQFLFFSFADFEQIKIVGNEKIRFGNERGVDKNVVFRVTAERRFYFEPNPFDRLPIVKSFPLLGYLLIIKSQNLLKNSQILRFNFI